MDPYRPLLQWSLEMLGAATLCTLVAHILGGDSWLGALFSASVYVAFGSFAAGHLKQPVLDPLLGGHRGSRSPAAAACRFVSSSSAAASSSSPSPSPSPLPSLQRRPEVPPSSLPARRRSDTVRRRMTCLGDPGDELGGAGVVAGLPEDLLSTYRHQPTAGAAQFSYSFELEHNFSDVMEVWWGLTSTGNPKDYLPPLVKLKGVTLQREEAIGPDGEAGWGGGGGGEGGAVVRQRLIQMEADPPWWTKRFVLINEFDFRESSLQCDTDEVRSGCVCVCMCVCV